jgi:hypothetical protein
MDDADVRGLMDACGCGKYPQGFLEDYEPFECLADHEGCQTLLVKNKRTGMFYVAKCYAAGYVPGHATETEILKKLQRAGLPRFVDEYQSGDMRCVIREYVEGMPLHQLPGRPDARRAAQIALSLCDLLIYLHGQTPPIIHRDIKPQNLIMGTDGQLWLIDFGISRLYREEAEADTACWGTQDFAAPEQYGFAQTDVRSDLYSFGILLGWLLTGEAKRENALLKIADRRLKKIVKKCTAFAPGDRYSSAVRLRADLLALDGRRRRQRLWKFGAAALCALCLCAGFAVGRYTGWLAPRAVGVAFAEPLIEQAVRESLRLDEGAAITGRELLSVTELFVCGDRAAQDAQTFQALVEAAATQSPARNGGIENLSDLAMMPNLTGVFLSQQNILDLSPLASLPALRVLDLRHNPVADLSPLAGLLQLSELRLYGTRVTDLSPLASCPQLYDLDVGSTFVASVDSLSGNTNIARLRMSKTPLRTLQGIENLPGLQEIEFSQVSDGDLTPLMKLPNLRVATLGETLCNLAQETLAGAEFIIEYRQF